MKGALRSRVWAGIGLLGVTLTAGAEGVEKMDGGGLRPNATVEGSRHLPKTRAPRPGGAALWPGRSAPWPGPQLERSSTAAEAPGSLLHRSAGSSQRAAPIQEESEAFYDGRYTFVRVRFGGSGREMRNLGYGRRGWGRRRQAPWQHDYPRAERNFAKILGATTLIDTRMEGNAGRILTLDDPEIFKYPVLNIIEVGYWEPSQEEVRNLRDYLEKGGFLIVDDFRNDRGFEMRNFQLQMNRVLPGRQIQLLPSDHEIFDSFFYIEDPLALVPPYGWYQAQYLGIFEDNDPVEGRIMVMINWNQDLQEYWEYSDVGYYPIDLSNEAYKFGVNYVVYAHTH